MNNINTNIKDQKKIISVISVKIEAQEAHHGCVALKVINCNYSYNT